MPILNRLRDLTASWFSRRRATPRRRRRIDDVPRFVAVERLEERAMLTQIVVNSTADVVAADGLVTLREALEAANTNMAVFDAPAGQQSAAGAIVLDRIVFDSTVFGGAGATITLDATGQGELVFEDDVTIDGDGGNGGGATRVTINGNDGTNRTRIFHVGGRVFLTGPRVVNLSGLTLREGNGAGTNGDAGRNGGVNTRGGAIYVDQQIRMSMSNMTFVDNGPGDRGGAVYLRSGTDVMVGDSRFLDNTATDGGGAIFANGSARLSVFFSSLNFNRVGDIGGALAGGGGSTIRVEGSTLLGNTAARGGAIFVVQNNGAEIVNSTLSRNTAGDGGAVYASGGGLTLRNTTVVDNRSTALAGGLSLNHGVNTILRNSLVVGNLNQAGNFFQDIVGTVQFGGVAQRFSAFNVVGTANASGGIQNGRSGNKVGFSVLDVVESTARDNGGPTLTHRPVAGGPAVNGGDPNFTPPPTTDQRGMARVLGGLLDVGAVELA